MRNMLTLLLTVTLLAAASRAGTLVNLEEAAEMTDLTIRLDGSASAQIFARVCDDCELLVLRADSRTRIERGRTLLSLEQAAQLRARGATVLFDPATLRITRILYWN